MNLSDVKTVMGQKSTTPQLSVPIRLKAIDAQLCRTGSRTVNKHLRDQFSLVSRGFLPSLQQIKLRQYLVLEGTRHLQGQMPSIAAQIFLEVGLKPT